MNTEAPKTPNQDPIRPTEEDSTLPVHKPRVVVKFQDSVQFPYEDGVEKYFDPENQAAWKQIVTAFPGITLKRAFTSLPPEKIRALVARSARRDKAYRSKNFLAYFAIEYPPNANPHELVRALLSWKAVQTAYLEGTPAPPPAVNPNDTRFSRQDYLDPAPLGIDASFAWPRPGGDGEGTRFVDLEQGWGLNHPDLPTAAITQLPGHNRFYQSHGASVLGILVAVDNTVFHVGIAPKASASIISEWRSSTAYNTADAIMVAISELDFGDVLLLETQYLVDHRLWPIEWQLAAREWIETGVSEGIVVIEAAGNGRNDLDPPAWENSGAVMVGAATATHPHVKTLSSNFGSRIDCYAWGESVDTLSAEPPRFTTNFSGTSSASAIVAGAALIVQGIAKKKFGRFYWPHELRAILSNPDHGTKSQNHPTDRIGVMPNLKEIVTRIDNESIAPPAPSPDS